MEEPVGVTVGLYRLEPARGRVKAGNRPRRKEEAGTRVWHRSRRVIVVLVLLLQIKAYEGEVQAGVLQQWGRAGWS